LINIKICSIEGCKDKHEAKGYCKKHYRAFHKYGDPLYKKEKKDNVKKYSSSRKPRVSYEENHKIINNVEHKLCSECGKWLPMNSDNFYKNKSNYVDGFHPYCKECTKLKNTEWKNNNRDKVRNWDNQYAKTTRRRVSKRKHTTKQRLSGYGIKWRQENKDKVKQYNFKRMNKNHDISKNEWESCKSYFKYSCAYCGISEKEAKLQQGQYLHKEHVHHDGADDLSNCVPACRSCNSQKWEYEFEEWYNEDNLRFSIKRFNIIIAWLNEDYKRYIE